MVKVKFSKRKMTMLLVIFLAVVLLVVALVTSLEKDAERAEGYKREAMVVGLTRLKAECQKEGKKPEVCDALEGEAQTVEDHTGTYHWIVSGRSVAAGFDGSVTMVRSNNGEYSVLHYVRNTGVQ